jgi:hypothetical protein
MSLHRSIFVAVAALCSVGLSSAALADCCGWSKPAPVYYAYTGCGSCSVAAYAPITYATPIAPAPIRIGCGGCGTPRVVATYAPARAWHGWGTGCGACGTSTAVRVFAAPVAPTPTWGTGCVACGVRIQPAPLYVVDQGPDYTGPGITVPYRTWERTAAYTPYGPGYYRWHRYYRGYHAHAFEHSHDMFRGSYHTGHAGHG